MRFRPRIRASIESTLFRTSSGEEEDVREEAVASFRVVLRAVDSFSTLKWALLKFLRRSSKGRRRRGWSWVVRRLKVERGEGLRE